MSPRILDPKVGLCSQCKHSRAVENTRGSTFFMCELSSTDQRFPKYPRLPVLACDGFEENKPSQDSSNSSP